mmetsp:Transcript_7019/g.17003  ORF Transcript_7019/g.17003 Transcript_7019/m.17003 type:complete len:319 (-) Transcript_7019:45-1001(-)
MLPGPTNPSALPAGLVRVAQAGGVHAFPPSGPPWMPEQPKFGSTTGPVPGAFAAGAPRLPSFPGGAGAGPNPLLAMMMQSNPEMMMQSNPDIVSHMTRQAAEAYDQARHAGIAPEVAELQDHFALDDRATKALDIEMKKRRDTFEDDMRALWVGLEGARNPSGLLMLKIRDMHEGSFKGMSDAENSLADFSKKYRLDPQAVAKLAEVLPKREDPDGDLKKIGKHLERSNKPSSLVMMMLRDLRNGKPIKDPEYQAAIGSVAHEKELSATMRKDSGKNAKRSRSRKQQRQRSPSRKPERARRGRSRSERRQRSRSRRRR